MSRYIEVDKLYNKVIDAENYYSKLDNFESQTKYKFLLNVITSMIDSTPSEDVVPVVHAKWIVDRDYGDCRCSACDSYYEDNGYTIPDYWNYCPHCGAKMDGR